MLCRHEGVMVVRVLKIVVAAAVIAFAYWASEHD